MNHEAWSRQMTHECAASTNFCFIGGGRGIATKQHRNIRRSLLRQFQQKCYALFSDSYCKLLFFTNCCFEEISMLLTIFTFVSPPLMCNKKKIASEVEVNQFPVYLVNGQKSEDVERKYGKWVLIKIEVISPSFIPNFKW